MFVCPLAIESRSCLCRLCRRCRRSCRRSTDRSKVNGGGYLFATGRRGPIETIPRHYYARFATQRGKEEEKFLPILFPLHERRGSLRREIFEIIRSNANEFRFSIFVGIFSGAINRGEWRARSTRYSLELGEGTRVHRSSRSRRTRS